MISRAVAGTVQALLKSRRAACADCPRANGSPSEIKSARKLDLMVRLAAQGQGIGHCEAHSRFLYSGRVVHIVETSRFSKNDIFHITPIASDCAVQATL